MNTDRAIGAAYAREEMLDVGSLTSEPDLPVRPAMSSLGRSRSFAAIIWWCLLFAPFEAAPAQTSTRVSEERARDRIVFSQSLPKLNGDHLQITIVEVTYGPGESSPPHSHPCPVMAYVLEGALHEKVTGKPQTIYKAGESFYEARNGIHEISANASQIKPAKFLAYFVCDREVPLSVTPPTSK
jgi:quercetin dioxygenase-like cupin family protein